ncbi:MAG: hypothetical protein NTV08_02085 [Verrucomicrobia bacterium]|nr:hypothetical protein [Verrucomicrobiota bacterium]
MLRSSDHSSVLKKSTAIFLWLCSASVVLASDKPAIAPATTAAAHKTSDEVGQHAAAGVAAAIEALGANPSTRLISNIVFNAVRKSPADVLPIVHTAVLASPQAAAPEIVTAATAAVPDPWKKVVYQRITSPVVKKSAPDFKAGPDGKEIADGKRTAAPGGPGAKSKPEDPTLTLAEAIVRTALDAQPGLSLSALQSAADIAIVGDPSVLLRYIQSPRSISGVGDAGTSNYANEPLRRGVSNTAPVPAPNPPVVSR